MQEEMKVFMKKIILEKITGFLTGFMAVHGASLYFSLTGHLDEGCEVHYMKDGGVKYIATLMSYVQRNGVTYARLSGDGRTFLVEVEEFVRNFALVPKNGFGVDELLDEMRGRAELVAQYMEEHPEQFDEKEPEQSPQVGQVGCGAVPEGDCELQDVINEVGGILIEISQEDQETQRIRRDAERVLASFMSQLRS